MSKLAVKDLDRIVLKHGAHRSRREGVCAMEAVAWLAGREHTDHPECVSPILGAFLRKWNDDADDQHRQTLKPYLPRVLNTVDDGQDELRGWLCADWLIRVYTPAWLELAGVKDSAAALRALPEIRDLAGVKTARPKIDTAKKEARAAGDAAGDAAGAAAWDAAWDAAGDAAWDAARAAAGAAAGDAAWDAARDAAGDAARAAAWDAAGAAAWDAAGAAARAAAWDAAWDAAGDAAGAALKPTADSLHLSALELLDRLIDPSRVSNPA